MVCKHAHENFCSIIKFQIFIVLLLSCPIAFHAKKWSKVNTALIPIKIQTQDRASTDFPKMSFLWVEKPQLGWRDGQRKENMQLASSARNLAKILEGALGHSIYEAKSFTPKISLNFCQNT